MGVLHRGLAAGLALAAAVTALPGTAQTYPAKTVRIVTTPPGNATDLLARLVAQQLAAKLGQPFVVDNRGIAGVESVARAPADGHTLLLYTSPLWLMGVFGDEVAWDTLRDFAPITASTSTPNVLVVHPSLPAKNVKEFIALARARRADLNYASGSTGSSAHIAAEMFKSMARVDMVRINFKGTGPALTSLMSGEMQVMFPAAGSAMPHVKSGRLRALGVTSAEPSGLAPGLPTVASAGLPGYESVSMSGFFAPAKTPPAVLNLLHQEIVRVLKTPEHKDKLFEMGLEVVGNTPADFTAFIKSEMGRVATIARPPR